MEKYNLLPQQLLHEGTLKSVNLFKPKPLKREQILRVHTEAYLDKLESLSLSRKEERATGFPLSQKLVEREIEIAGGTLKCVDYALEYGASGNIAGGTHHAYSDRGEGFCLLNDIAIGAMYALEERKLKQILVVDLDVHQGNGTAEIFKDEDRVFTFSMHGASNYPLKKEKSDLDIALKDRTSDKEYLEILEENLSEIFPRISPDLIFYQCGVDVLASDKLGRLALSLEGCKRRDELVFGSAHKYRIPVVFCMGGGYSESIKIIIEAHANTYRTANEYYF